MNTRLLRSCRILQSKCVCGRNASPNHITTCVGWLAAYGYPLPPDVRASVGDDPDLADDYGRRLALVALQRRQVDLPLTANQATRLVQKGLV